MQTYLIIGHDGAGSKEKRLKVRDAHLANLAKLNAQGRVHAAGPFRANESEGAPFAGSMLLIDFESEADAREWLAQDAYGIEQVYERIEIYPYVDAMPLI